ncbi:hypothetical protein [Pseudarthrobacter sp. BRE9]|uniref:hypothetical protein n=1 Tax=Pseudarthrobacter sp. BRE9 TaxID=2962582 RepID=UPI00288247FC|nr:hypothetical protein [Pseudarthrobacter sp. BRE9]MDT0170920.1 hypothetical protein [Pseudarthrobacter sp. BRE9]
MRNTLIAAPNGCRRAALAAFPDPARLQLAHRFIETLLLEMQLSWPLIALFVGALAL